MAAAPAFPLLQLRLTKPKSSASRLKPYGTSKFGVVKCGSSSNGREPDSVDDGVKSVERLLEEKRRAELSARIASGEFTVQKSGFPSQLRNGLSKLGVPSEILEILFKWVDDVEEYPKIPEAKGSIKSIRSEAFFIPLYELYLTYGGIFRLTFGPKSFLIVSDPSIAKHILRDNSKSYSKGILAEILDFVMGKGLIPADGEIWRLRRRAIVPALHQKYVAAMISLFGLATDRLCQKLDVAATDGEDVEMESLFSRLTLDIIGKAVFNYDFDSLTNDTGIVEAVYTALREAEDRSVSPIPTWEIPIWKDISPRQRKVTEALKLINGVLDDLIATCKSMVDEEELQFYEEYMNEQDPSILHFLLASGDDVSSKQLRDDLMTLLIAGHETTASVLTGLSILSKEPSVVAKLQDEVDSVLGDRFPTIDDMKKLKYTTRVINESLRLYPQPPVLIRRSLEKDVLGEYPIKRASYASGHLEEFIVLLEEFIVLFEKLSFWTGTFHCHLGEDIFISVWNLHRGPSLWQDADKFNPERWPLDGPNPNETNQNFCYLPFGGDLGMFGTRHQNLKVVNFEYWVPYLIVLGCCSSCDAVRRFNFQMALGAPPVEMTTGATIHTTKGLKMTVTRRIKPPIIPEINMQGLTMEASSRISEAETQLGEKGEVSQAHS
ncbi:Protein LUTEIN DEFICIENT 5 [Hibiscus syriacus]|uniref:Protein LUTEIN DEFICIENT 5 n=1 Tax=Hibiscus syriacus TaxID=106335 RepID=A0A6A3APD7_HIBSY|nr:Protein LUTEIN DEFICIENT 5 [Hibiscus syriacus]